MAISPEKDKESIDTRYLRPYNERTAFEKKYFFSDERIQELVRQAYTPTYEKRKQRK